MIAVGGSDDKGVLLYLCSVAPRTLIWWPSYYSGVNDVCCFIPIDILVCMDAIIS